MVGFLNSTAVACPQVADEVFVHLASKSRLACPTFFVTRLAQQQ